MKLKKGGSFIIEETKYEDIFIPEEFTEEERMMAQAAFNFVETEIIKNLDKIEVRGGTHGPELLKKAGDLDLLGVSVSEEYSGLGLSNNLSMLITESLGASSSFSTSIGVQTTIGILPILYYGNDAQKKKYLSQMVKGTLKSAYCLTEPGAGSDANSGKTNAKLTADGKHYIINGQKIWISSAGFADIFIVFAKIDDDKNHSAFIVEKSYGGITMSEEEKKMGIKGSSTRQIFFENCKVPIENLLSERGNGFKIAVNVLNMGRLKLGVGATGAARQVLNIALKYSKERKQFQTEIFNFGAIKEKIAKMVAGVYAGESISYRISGEIDNNIENNIKGGMNKAEASLKALADFALETSINKVFGSEMSSYVVDEAVQIYGGMGYSAESPVERPYRDARITRIYEGTNEINRMLCVSILLKKAMKGELDLMTHAKAVSEELTGVPSFSSEMEVNQGLETEKKHLNNLKKVFLMVGGKAAMTFVMEIEKEQEILLRLADILIQIYMAESCILRAEKINSLKKENDKLASLCSKLNLYMAMDKIYIAAKEIICCFPENEEQKFMFLGLKRFIKPYNLNIKKTIREIADNYKPRNYAFE